MAELRGTPGGEEAELGVAVDGPGEEGAEGEGGGHAREGDRQGTAEAGLDNVHAKLQAHDEHVEGEAKLGDREEVALGIAGGLGFIPGKEPSLEVGEEEAEEGGAEEDPGDHFGDHLGLAKLGGDQPDQAAEKEDHRELEKEVDGEVEVIHAAPWSRVRGNGNTLLASR